MDTHGQLLFEMRIRWTSVALTVLWQIFGCQIYAIEIRDDSLEDLQGISGTKAELVCEVTDLR